MDLMNIQLETEVEAFLQIIRENGFRSYYLLNSTKQKNRIVTDAPIQVITQLFHQVLKTSSWPGGVTVIYWQVPVEVYNYADSLESYCERFIFTRDALIWDWENKKLIDFFSAKEDEEKRVIRTREDLSDAFTKQPSSILEGIYLAGLLNYKLPEGFIATAKEKDTLLKLLKTNTIRDYLVQIILLPHPAKYLMMLKEIGLFKLFIPEVEALFQCQITEEHNVGEHSLAILDYLPPDINLRFAGLFHDLSKTEYAEDESIYSDHEERSAKMAKKILDRLNLFMYLGGQNINHHYILNLIRNHMFSYEAKHTTKKAVERLISRVGLENIDALLLLREANRKAGSVSKQCEASDNDLKRRIKKLLGRY